MRDLGAVGITEPFEIQEFRVTGIARIEEIEAGRYEVTFFKSKNGDRIANVALEMSMGAIPQMLVMLAQAIGCDMVATCPAIKKAVN